MNLIETKKTATNYYDKIVNEHELEGRKKYIYVHNSDSMEIESPEMTDHKGVVFECFRVKGFTVAKLVN